MQRDIDAQVEAAFAEADSHGSMKTGVIASPRTMFDDVFHEMPRHLREQREQVGE
jgi:2-oxoisovalerate dehydrogenase E1 component alpha subunit